jgi:hypothetical protein
MQSPIRDGRHRRVVSPILIIGHLEEQIALEKLAGPMELFDSGTNNGVAG